MVGPACRDRLRVAAHTKEALKRGHGISETKGPEATASLPFSISIPELAICLVGKVHATTKFEFVNLNFSH